MGHSSIRREKPVARADLTEGIGVERAFKFAGSRDALAGTRGAQLFSTAEVSAQPRHIGIKPYMLFYGYTPVTFAGGLN